MQNIEELTTLQSPLTRTPPRRRIAAACETCKRRKERCNGARPCGRCSERGVERHCFYGRRGNDRSNGKQRISERGHPTRNAPWSPHGPTRHTLDATLSPAASEHYSRLIRDRKGSYMFIGDSANLSFLQIIRRVASDCIGSCPLVDDPLRYNMVEASPEGRPSWLNAEAQSGPPTISLSVSQQLIRNYLSATNGVLDLFDEAELFEHLPVCEERRVEDSPLPNAIHYLMLALGAQASTEDQDDLADKLFTHGRYLTAVHFMEDASIPTIQAYVLITTYLLGACRRNAAFMYLGIAVRAAYAIGLHRKEISETFAREECMKRERLWRAIRSLDLFMCASLGRPPSTSETRDTEAVEDYSTWNDLCAILEKILIDVYSRRMISTEALSSIGSHHRRWASRFFRGLERDKLEHSQVSEEPEPEIGLMHVKAAYYWSIILLTRPFLVESVTLHIKRARTSANSPSEPCTNSDTNKVLVNACVDSAIRILDLSKGLLDCRLLPRRLPFLVNSVFIAALVLGFAYFGDLDQTFPLQRHLRDAQQLLVLFSHDVVAQRNASIISYLCDAAEAYQEKRTAQNMDYQSLAVGSMFGQIHRLRAQVPSRTESPSRSDHMDDSAEVQPTKSPNGSRANVPMSSQPLPEQIAESEEEHRYAFDMQQEFGDLPFPPMTPRTLWFDALDENMPLFSTISNSNAQYGVLPRYD